MTKAKAATPKAQPDATCWSCGADLAAGNGLARPIVNQDPNGGVASYDRFRETFRARDQEGEEERTALQAKIDKAKPKPIDRAALALEPTPAPASGIARRDAANLHRLELGGQVAVREAAGDTTGDGRTVEGIILPYGVPTEPGATREFGGAREQVAHGAFREWIAQREATGNRPVPILDEHDGHVIGSATEFEERPEGLWARGRLFTNVAARDFAERVNGGIPWVSPEFAYGRLGREIVQRSRDLVEHVRILDLRHIAGSWKPAYRTAAIAVRDQGGSNVNLCEQCGQELVPGVAHLCPARQGENQAPTMQRSIPGAAGAVGMELALTQEQVADLARRVADETMRGYAERGAFGPGSAPTDEWADIRAFDSLGHLVRAAAADDADPQLVRWAARALADQLTVGMNAGVVTPGIVGDVRRLVDLGRPAITAFGGPAPLEGSGLSFDFPYFDGTLTDLVAEQATQKTEIESAVVDIKKASVTIKTYAGGSDIAYQLLRRSTPGYLEIYTRIILAAWGLVTDAAFVTALEAGSVTVDLAEAITAVDATELKNFMVDAAVAVHLATGSPAEFALAGTNAFKQAAKVTNPTPVVNAVGSMNLRQMEVNIAGLPVILDPNVTTGKYIVSNRSAARWHEEGPFQATSEDVAKLGKNVAYWSLGAPAIYVPAAVVETYDVTP